MLQRVSDPILDTLKARFGHPGFRPLQRQAVDAALEDRDVFVLMPTGGGKSLCYQLPAVTTPGLTVVISPLIALMQDQSRQLWANGISAAALHSGLDAEQIQQSERDAIDGKLDLLYLSPERLVSSRGAGLLRQLLSLGRLDRFAIDEAHCISEWGHDFRPEYRMLGRLREDERSPLFAKPILALTATATPRVAKDIVRQLHLREPVTITAGFERPNLYYEIRPRRKVFSELLDYLQANPTYEGIVYCNSRRKVDTLTMKLQSHGIEAVGYHAGREREERNKNQEDFTFGRARVCVATIAFGMGIDKPDVRFVIHVDPPRHLEGYYQQTGRAGRDGLASDCIMFFSPSDAHGLRRFIDDISDPAERENAEQQLREVVRFATETSCRMPRLLGYFGQTHEGGCGHCDNCLHPPAVSDRTLHARMLLSAVARTEQRYGLSHVIDVLRGSKSKRVTDRQHHELSVYGLGQTQTKSYWLHLADALIDRGELQVAGSEFPVVTLTPNSKAVLRNEVRVEVPISKTVASSMEPNKREGADVPVLSAEDQQLFESLRELRKELAREQGVPPYVVFSDVTLKHLAARKPTDELSMLSIPGIGRTKYERYGQAFGQVIETFEVTP